jgi:hypothetical protein
MHIDTDRFLEQINRHKSQSTRHKAQQPRRALLSR